MNIFEIIGVIVVIYWIIAWIIGIPILISQLKGTGTCTHKPRKGELDRPHYMCATWTKLSWKKWLSILTLYHFIVPVGTPWTIIDWNSSRKARDRRHTRKQRTIRKVSL
jgi:hypothetical protein